ncbi:zinc transporter ZntB [Orbaceae bacterium ESL0721]|nr:zinc transporter ZntB [Orbaceae bacterium ESL0721]
MSTVKRNDSLSSSLFMASDPVYFCQLDGKGKAINSKKDKDKIEATVAHPCWIHLDYSKSATRDWINHTDLLPPLAKKALIGKDPTPKEMRFDTGMLVILKGVNVTANRYPDPIITFRFYIMDKLIISSCNKKIDAIDIIEQNLKKGVGPVDVADWLIQISDALTDKANLSFDHIHNRVIALEDTVLNDHVLSHREIGFVRRELIILRRLLVPSQDIIVKLATERVSWIDDNDRQHLHDTSTRLSHCVSDIDNGLLRISSIMELINSLLAESMNKRIYFMTLFTLIFNPITFLTSLLGVNLAGIPFSDSGWAFGIFAIVLMFVGVVLIFWLKFKKWL